MAHGWHLAEGVTHAMGLALQLHRIEAVRDAIPDAGHTRRAAEGAVRVAT